MFPSMGFLYQYLLIKKRKSVGTFSINVCGVMLLSNLLRIAFYIYKEFSIALLAQSILNIIMQVFLILTRLCCCSYACKLWISKATSKNTQLKLRVEIQLCSMVFGSGKKYINIVKSLLI